MYAGFRLQVLMFRRSSDRIPILIAIPFYVLIFMSVTRNADRPDLEHHAILAPALAGIWTFALLVASEIIEGDRWMGILETLVSSPASTLLVVAGRTVAVGVLSLVSFAETWLCALIFFGADVRVPHPGWFFAGLLATCVATVATSIVLAALFVLGRSATLWQASLGYPFYVLGGIFVPASLLPSWLHPVSDLIFLSWSAELLRASLRPDPMPSAALRQLTMVLLIAAVTAIIGWLLTVRVLDRVRATGRVSLA
ncbi:ABC transporter permease [Micromonospora lupini]|uniref:ABC transporter permease n=1 Tax=Micromonospora lupini TaxID=285679 RepID=UPI0033DAFF8F